ncbi:MAG: Asp-tRNA(Asn)/Glu-tRNA(Gln) amidotransferase subunit GatB, partial [Sphingomonas parapaucimobilis]
ERIHVEQDAGKLMHDQHPTRSYVDLNRSGVALMEIVSRPDMRSPAEAGAYLRKLRAILRYVGSCDGNMEEGSMRADVNVSVRKPGDEFGTRTETKNVNSVRFVMAAIEYEAKRQVAVLEDGGKIVQETRLFNVESGTTRSMRSKEDAHDYRYFPDPDLLPLELTDAFLDECRASLPELPDAKRRRYEALGLTAYNAGVLTAEVETARWFDTLLGALEGSQARPAQAANWVAAELFGALNRLGKDITESPVSPSDAAELLALVADGTLSGSLSKQVFEIMLETGDGPSKIVEERGLKQTSDTGAIEAVIAEVLEKNPNQLGQYRAGKEALFGFFVGQTMKAMGGMATPAVVTYVFKTARAGLFRAAPPPSPPPPGGGAGGGQGASQRVPLVAFPPPSPPACGRGVLRAGGACLRGLMVWRAACAGFHTSPRASPLLQAGGVGGGQRCLTETTPSITAHPDPGCAPRRRSRRRRHARRYR